MAARQKAARSAVRSSESQFLIVPCSGVLETLGQEARQTLQRELRFMHQYDGCRSFVTTEAIQDVCSQLSKILRPSHFGIEIADDWVLHEYGCEVRLVKQLRGFAPESVVMVTITTTDLQVRELFNMRHNEAARQLPAKGVGGKYVFGPALLLSYWDEKDPAHGRFRQYYGPISPITQELLPRKFSHLQLDVVPVGPPRPPSERVARRPQAQRPQSASAVTDRLSAARLPPALESPADFPALCGTKGQAELRPARAPWAGRRPRPTSVSNIRNTRARAWKSKSDAP